MLNDNAQKVNNNQPSIPQTFDSPPMPNTAVPPLTQAAPAIPPLTPSVDSVPDFASMNAQAPAAPTTMPSPTEYPTIPSIPQVAMEPPKKKSPVVTIAVVLLIIAVLAVVAYFVGKMYLPGTTSTDADKTNNLQPAQVDESYTETIPQMEGEPAPTDDPANPLVPPEFEQTTEVQTEVPVENTEVSP